MANILTETFDEILPEFTSSGGAGFGQGLHDEIRTMLDSCEADLPFIDLDAQFDGLANYLEELRAKLKETVVDKLSNPAP